MPYIDIYGDEQPDYTGEMLAYSPSGGVYMGVGSGSYEAYEEQQEAVAVAAGAGQVTQAGFGAFVPAALRFATRALPWVAGAALGGALGGGDEGQEVIGGVPLGGPGLAEPPARMVLKEWHISTQRGDLQFYLVQTPRGKRIFMYNTRTKSWKSWLPPRLSVIGKNLPSHKMIVRLRRNLKRHTADAKTILQLTSPQTLMKSRGWRKPSKRR